MPLGTEVGLGQASVLDGDQAPPLPQGGGAPPIFGAYLLWPNAWIDQHATWLGGRPQPKGHCVTWGHSSPPQRGRSPSIFGPCLLWPNGWMEQDGTWYRGSPRPSDIVLDGVGIQLPPPKGARPPVFGPCLLRPNSWKYVSTLQCEITHTFLMHKSSVIN